jgi:hypothetical protein
MELLRSLFYRCLYLFKKIHVSGPRDSKLWVWWSVRSEWLATGALNHWTQRFRIGKKFHDYKLPCHQKVTYSSCVKKKFSLLITLRCQLQMCTVTDVLWTKIDCTIIYREVTKSWPTAQIWTWCVWTCLPKLWLYYFHWQLSSWTRHLLITSYYKWTPYGLNASMKFTQLNKTDYLRSTRNSCSQKLYIYIYIYIYTHTQ